MRKRLGVAAATTAALAFGMVGTASAQSFNCPTATGAGPATSDPISLNTPGQTVAGFLEGVGWGQALVGTNGTNVTYTGSLNGTPLDLGYGDISNGSVGTAGVSGSADGQLPLDAGAAEGSLNAPVGGTPSLTFKVRAGTAGGEHVCVSLP